ncbi:hypothetical protein C7E17_26595, partial [Stenotrophomonas maltophilia]
TVTPMGGRLLRRWLHRPLRLREVLVQRHHAVETLIDRGADATVTPMGGRLLRRWLHRPLRLREVLVQRHHAVET